MLAVNLNIADSSYPSLGFMGDCFMRQSKTSSLALAIIKQHID